jgi:putative FmdB family regulatory protein
MPIYEYYCQNCGHKFELLRSFSEADSPTHCEKCQASDVKRMLSKVNSFSDGVSLNSSGSCSGCTSHSCSGCGMG